MSNSCDHIDEIGFARAVHDPLWHQADLSIFLVPKFKVGPEARGAGEIGQMPLVSGVTTGAWHDRETHADYRNAAQWNSIFKRGHCCF
jgi:hypothetical protein